MTIIILRNRDVYNSALQFDSERGPINEILSTEIPDQEIFKQGNYIKHGGHFFGIYATEIGPKFFRDYDSFLLNDPKLIFQHIKGYPQHHFKFFYDEKELMSLSYDHWDDLDIDPWSDEDFIDFFIWITKSYKNPQFIHLWTL